MAVLTDVDLASVPAGVVPSMFNASGAMVPKNVHLWYGEFTMACAKAPKYLYLSPHEQSLLFSVLEDPSMGGMLHDGQQSATTYMGMTVQTVSEQQNPCPDLLTLSTDEGGKPKVVTTASKVPQDHKTGAQGVVQPPEVGFPHLGIASPQKAAQSLKKNVEYTVGKSWNDDVLSAPPPPSMPEVTIELPDGSVLKVTGSITYNVSIEGGPEFHVKAEHEPKLFSASADPKTMFAETKSAEPKTTPEPPVLAQGQAAYILKKGQQILLIANEDIVVEYPESTTVAMSDGKPVPKQAPKKKPAKKHDFPL